jgi:hypothetical protein
MSFIYLIHILIGPRFCSYRKSTFISKNQVVREIRIEIYSSDIYFLRLLIFLYFSSHLGVNVLLNVRAYCAALYENQKWASTFFLKSANCKSANTWGCSVIANLLISYVCHPANHKSVNLSK